MAYTWAMTSSRFVSGVSVAIRLAVAVVVIAAVATTWVVVAPAQPLNFFGFFTIQSNLIGAVVAAIGAVRLARGTPAGIGWSVARWCAATYLVLVGVIYWLLLAPLGAAGGVPVVWANLALHGVTPALALVDWLLVRDRMAVPLRLLPLVLVYPLVWTAVVLVRGATDGWVPYPFLSPSQGYPVVWGFVAVIAGAFTGAAALLRLAARRSPA